MPFSFIFLLWHHAILLMPYTMRMPFYQTSPSIRHIYLIAVVRLMPHTLANSNLLSSTSLYKAEDNAKNVLFFPINKRFSQRLLCIVFYCNIRKPWQNPPSFMALSYDTSVCTNFTTPCFWCQYS